MTRFKAIAVGLSVVSVLALMVSFRPSVTQGQSYDSKCDNFEQCWGNIHFQHYERIVACDKKLKEAIKKCREDHGPGRDRTRCIVGHTCLGIACNIEANLDHCFNKKACCTIHDPGDPAQGTFPCHLYDNNCPAECNSS